MLRTEQICLRFPPLITRIVTECLKRLYGPHLARRARLPQTCTVIPYATSPRPSQNIPPPIATAAVNVQHAFGFSLFIGFLLSAATFFYMSPELAAVPLVDTNAVCFAAAAAEHHNLRCRYCNGDRGDRGLLLQQLRLLLLLGADSERDGFCLSSHLKDG